MSMLTNTALCDSHVDQSMSEGALGLEAQRYGMVWVGNRKGLAPALGHIALAFAQGNDIFGYRLAGRKYKTVMLTSDSLATLIHWKLLTGRNGDDLPELMTFDDLLTDREKKPTSTQIVRRLDRKLRDAEIVIVDGYGSGDKIDHSGLSFAPADFEVACV